MKISMLDTQMTTSMEARNSAGTWQKTAAADVEPATARPVPVVNIQQGTIVCMNAAAMRSIDRKPGDEDDGIPADPKEWPRRASIQAEGQTFYLSVPNQALDTASGAPEPQLPPRLAKIARLVISGCTDKQIATRTGLSFSTVRTYVRQIYRRIGVHSRVELVHASNTSLARD
jgi:DNA-binding NarL/FixJ family response regulator